MSEHKDGVKKFGDSDVAKCFVFMAVGLFIAGAGFGGYAVCPAVQGCSWTIGLPSIVVMIAGAAMFMRGMFRLADGLESSEGDI